MAMIKCPQCKGKIADTALTCPHCGHVLSSEVIKKDKEKISVLKREYSSYSIDILIIVLPLSLIALMILNKYLLILAIPLSLISIIWGILSIKKKRRNNKIAKDCIYYDKENKTFTIYDINIKEYSFLANDILNIKKDNLITQRVTLTYKIIDEEKNTFKTSKIDLGYAKNSDVKEFKTKLKNIVDVDLVIDD